MLLGGLWHGADWTFVVWGGVHGIALCVHKIYKNQFIKILSPPPIINGHQHTKYKVISNLLCFIIANLFTNIFVCFSWIFFRADNFLTAHQIIIRIFTWQDGIIQVYVWVIVAILVVFIAHIISILNGCRDRSSKLIEITGFYPILDLSKFSRIIVFFIELGLIIGLAYTGANPFIYFQF
jgi:alginate O-acetyltransferase complex protein AlgI